MALPKINSISYTLNLPSSKEKILFRPFTVRDEKLLLMAADGDDEQQIRALRDVVDSCILNNPDGRKKVNVLKLAMFDLYFVWDGFKKNPHKSSTEIARAKYPKIKNNFYVFQFFTRTYPYFYTYLPVFFCTYSIKSFQHFQHLPNPYY